mgnify:CR=1 FL=1
MHSHNAWHSAQGIRSIITSIRQSPIEPEMTIPHVLVVAPPKMETPKGPIAAKFVGGENKCIGLADEYERVAKELACPFSKTRLLQFSNIVGHLRIIYWRHRFYSSHQPKYCYCGDCQLYD